MHINRVFLIASGAYANPEITSDFGLLPTSFLPVGHNRLIELQLDLIGDFDCKKFITLPENYKLLERDKNLLESHDVKVHWVNPSINLAQAILSFIRALDLNGNSEFYLLHGDTLFKKLEQRTNLIYYGFTDMFYQWGQLEDVTGKNVHKKDFYQAVISGYFTFNNVPLLEKELHKSNSFEIALNFYNHEEQFQIIEGEGWLDFGHSNLYYKSKRELNVTRNFNRTIVHKNFIKKSSINCNKIQSEFSWFNQVPAHLSRFIPTVWDYLEENIEASYKIEFIGAPTLQEKWVFGNLPNFVYYNVINQVFSFINDIKNIRFEEYKQDRVYKLLNELYIKKTVIRVNEFCRQLNFDIEAVNIINGNKYPSLNEFCKEVNEAILLELNKDKANNMLTMMHGDLCFSNILSDTRSNSIKFIDPRGGLDNAFKSTNKVVGDYKYDIAKFGHSLIGNYDYIVTGFYKLETDFTSHKFSFKLEHSRREELEKFFYDKVKELGVSPSFIKASIANLFISMLPLHNEDKDRQLALLLNAYIFYYNK